MLLKFRILLAALFLILSAPAARAVRLPPPASQDQPVSSSPRTVTDEAGRTVRVPASVRRIVSLAPDLTETLYALGAGDRLVGDTTYCDTPPEAKSKPHVGDPRSPSLEAVVALHPDLVFASASINFPATADALQKIGIPVYTADPHTVRGLLATFARLGDLIGSPSEGAALASSLRSRLDALQARLADQPPVHVLFLVWFDPPMSIGSNTFIADALRWAGAESVLVSDQSWPQPSVEEVLRLQPDYVILTADHEGRGSDIDALQSRPGWRDLMAVRSGRAIVVGDAIDRPSPGLVGAIEELARRLHPQIFAPCSSSAAEAAPCAP